MFSILRRSVKADGAALMGAMLFAIHPLQVESIAWVAEENNLLAGALSLAAIRMYLTMADATPQIKAIALDCFDDQRVFAGIVCQADGRLVVPLIAWACWIGPSCGGR